MKSTLTQIRLSCASSKLIRYNTVRLFLASLLSFLVCIFAAGCSSSRVYQTSGSDVPVGTVSEVLVTVRPGSLDAGSESWYRANSMSGTIRSALMEELRDKGKIAATGVTVEFLVTDFRLRSGSQVFWLGVMAGSDHLAGTVTVKNGTTVLKTFDASAKGNESLWSGLVTARITTGSRANVFSEKIARKIADQL